jgi:hypothetical protein
METNEVNIEQSISILEKLLEARYDEEDKSIDYEDKSKYGSCFNKFFPNNLDDIFGRDILIEYARRIGSRSSTYRKRSSFNSVKENTFIEDLFPSKSLTWEEVNQIGIGVFLNKESNKTCDLTLSTINLTELTDEQVIELLDYLYIDLPKTGYTVSSWRGGNDLKCHMPASYLIEHWDEINKRSDMNRFSMERIDSATKEELLTLCSLIQATNEKYKKESEEMEESKRYLKTVSISRLWDTMLSNLEFTDEELLPFAHQLANNTGCWSKELMNSRSKDFWFELFQEKMN